MYDLHSVSLRKSNTGVWSWTMIVTKPPYLSAAAGKRGWRACTRASTRCCSLRNKHDFIKFACAIFSLSRCLWMVGGHICTRLFPQKAPITLLLSPLRPCLLWDEQRDESAFGLYVLKSKTCLRLFMHFCFLQSCCSQHWMQLSIATILTKVVENNFFYSKTVQSQCFSNTKSYTIT